MMDLRRALSQAVLRRANGLQEPDSIIRVGDLEIDPDRRLVTRGSAVVSLTRTEWLLLQYLVANAGKVLVSAELLSNVWGPEYRDDLQYLRVWVSRLRRKLEGDPAHPKLIKTKQGIGYLLDVQQDTAPAPSASAVAS